MEAGAAVVAGAYIAWGYTNGVTPGTYVVGCIRVGTWEVPVAVVIGTLAVVGRMWLIRGGGC